MQNTSILVRIARVLSGFAYIMRMTRLYPSLKQVHWYAAHSKQKHDQACKLSFIDCMPRSFYKCPFANCYAALIAHNGNRQWHIGYKEPYN